ncbi:helix-turn-helix domain-containing protein [Salibacterium qingdaonense]|uniref:Helix-turn-helix domain-containing protein n=1 Tax=Salibacterium qingdaonense TaxID=266892 RepID=A0A1I4QWD1_9BACI|nr:helix-turn-helix transcriptional regulator [Salibacterium qingdaonense]SFM44095.1 Helix-turn-helix domain-containing protein [Salibacterium qingdaonense]
METVKLDKIKHLRKERKLSQSDMAGILGFNTLYPYHRKESGEQAFTADELHKIAKHFGYNLEYFFEDSVAKNATKSTSA